MVYRVYVEKKQGFDNEARALAAELRNLLGIEALEGVRLLNRYDAENITEALFSASVKTVFSEPQLDDTFGTLSLKEGETAFAVEYLPGQFDQRADSAAQCIQIIAQCDRPIIRTARVYVLSGRLGERELEKNTSSTRWRAGLPRWNSPKRSRSLMRFPPEWILSAAFCSWMRTG